MIQAYSGKCDGLVYYYNRKYGKMCARRLPKKKITPRNTRFRDIAVNLKALQLSDGFISDMKIYYLRYTNCWDYRKQPMGNWYSIFTKLMWQMSKEMDIDLLTLTRTRIEAENLPCRSVKQAVEWELIPPVIDYEWLTNTL